MSSGSTIALLGSPELGRELGKRGTVSDITMYNAARDGHAVTYVQPSQFPEKFPPLLTSLVMADGFVLAIRALDRAVAEAAATADLYAFDRPAEIVRGPDVGEEELRRAFKQLGLATATIRDWNAATLRDELEQYRVPPRPGSVRVPIDHAFPVKGVGAVALGVVRRGTLRVHDRLRLYPTPRVVEVRSLQVHDLDVSEAATGERVGLALKGVEAADLARGQVLAPESEMTVSPQLALKNVHRSPYFRGSLAPGASLYLQVGMQLAPAKLTSLEEGRATLVADRDLAYEPGLGALVSDLSVPSGPRAAFAGTAAPEA